MDQDGANPSYLTTGDSIVMTPRFSSNSQEITYMSLRPDSSTIYLFNLETARRESLGTFQGMVFAPPGAGDRLVQDRKLEVHAAECAAARR